MKRLALLLLLVGCTSTPPAPLELPKPVPPKKPTPIVTHKIKFLPHPTNEPYLLLHVEDGVRLKEQSVDTIRYIKELQGIVCFYEPSYDFCKENK
ncbi:Rz-like spanin [Vibrio phage phi 3]|uniref:Uncharacterized protein n=1 Tax=Vibrio phage phi 3 TaxID=1589298 RepID=A0A0B5H8T5_9CAUD|nr:Rz-like spanin [Vibrio phage phi 3]AJF40818.1 hypothetical protein SBVP3_0050 [Vibrio phage phi 3]